VTIGALMEFVGLSRSTFSKQHIRELLVEYGEAATDSIKDKWKGKGKRQSNTASERDKLIAELRVKMMSLEGSANCSEVGCF